MSPVTYLPARVSLNPRFAFLASLRRGIAVCLLAPVLSASAATYYVATTGNDANPGSLASPFRTIQKGATTANAGDAVYVRGGTYTETVTMTKSGTSSARITLSAYPGEAPVIDGNNYFFPNTTIAGTDPVTGNTYVWEGLLRALGSFISVSGFEVSRSHGRGITIKGTNNEVFDCNVRDSRGAGILVENANTVTVSGCSVSGAGNYAPYERAGGSPVWPGALMTRLSTNVVIQGCTVFNNWAEGIGPYSSSNITVQDCVVYDNFAAQIYLEHTRFATIQRNVVYGTNTAPWLRRGFPSVGILIGDESANTNPLGTDYTIVNNLIRGCGRGIAYWNGGSAGTGLRNSLIASNTLADSYDTAFGCLDIATGSHTNTLIINNIIRQSNPSLPIATITQNTGLAFSTNLWSRPVSGIQSSPTDVIGDPMLSQTGPTGPAQLLPDWFKLLGTSPARNSGAVSALVTEDYFRTTRDSSPDIGGHELTAAETRIAELEQQLMDCDNLVISLEGQLTVASDQVALLTAEKTTLTAALTAANAQMQSLGAHLGSAFDDTSFAIPGSTLSEQIANLETAVSRLNHGQQQALYLNLGGTKKIARLTSHCFAGTGQTAISSESSHNLSQ